MLSSSVWATKQTRGNETMLSAGLGERATVCRRGTLGFLFFLVFPPLLRSFVSLEFDIYIYRLPGLFQRSPALSDLVSFAFFSRVLYFCRARRGRRKSIESPNPYILFLFVSFHSSLLGRFSGFGAGALAAVALFLFVVFCPLYARCRRKERASIQNALIECRLPALSLTISLAPLLASPLQCRGFLVSPSRYIGSHLGRYYNQITKDGDILVSCNNSLNSPIRSMITQKRPFLLRRAFQAKPL